MYEYQATIVRWVDGDTVILNVDVGFHLALQNSFRIYGVNTPERGQPGYAQATAFNTAKLPPGTTIPVRTYKDADKYGRWLADIPLPDGTELAAALITAGLGMPYFGGHKEPFPAPVTAL